MLPCLAREGILAGAKKGALPGIAARYILVRIAAASRSGRRTLRGALMTAFDPAKQPKTYAPAPIEPQRQLEFLQLDESDVQRLRAMADDFEVWADDFVESFYRHLFAFDETAKFLQSPQTVARLKRSQREHLKSMLEAEWNADYYRQRRQVGHCARRSRHRSAILSRRFQPVCAVQHGETGGKARG